MEKNRESGFRQCVCKTCNDHSPRAGFKFEHNNVGYYCFNCGAKGRYEHPAYKISKSFRKILNDFDISNESIDRELAKNFLSKNDQNQTVTPTDSKTPNYELQEIKFPDGTRPITDFPDDYIWKVIAIEYLNSRKLSINDFPFYLSTHKDYENRLIIPYFRNGKLVFWQGRSFDEYEKKKRYLNPSVDKAGILFNYDRIFDFTDKPILITEGVFDAICVNGVALAGSDLSKFHIATFNRSKREKVFIIDKDKKGYSLGKKALDLGYNITWLDGSVRDVNDSIISMGKMWTVQNLMSNITSGLHAKLWLETINKG